MVLWSDKAKLTYQEVIEYLEYKWTEKEIHAFISRTDDIIIKISKNPYLFQQHKNNTLIRQAVHHENVSLIYQISEDQKTINLLTFWDNRQNPSNLKIAK
jgi:plasmid stabilization system protein ParE